MTIVGIDHIQLAMPAGREDDFVAFWSEVNRYMRGKPGFVYNRLHRATTPDARFRFINYVQWATEQHWRDFPPPTGAIFDVVCEYGEEAKAA